MCFRTFIETMLCPCSARVTLLGGYQSTAAHGTVCLWCHTFRCLKLGPGGGQIIDNL